MNFNLRAFPLTGSDPKRSKKGQNEKKIERNSNCSDLLYDI